MTENYQQILERIAARHQDEREQVFDLTIASSSPGSLTLTGRVLEQSNLDEFFDALPPETVADGSAVEVLRRPDNPLLTVATNLASLHRGTSFLEEQLSQLLYGRQVEVLEEEEKWAHVRCDDGYLGWIYRPYLREQPTAEPTHLVVEAVSHMRGQPGPGTGIVTRVMGGTYVTVLEVTGEWAYTAAHQTGWLPLSGLRRLGALPQNSADRRVQMMADAARLIGVPYLWGGTTAAGIDCSGLAQLVHRWSGLTLRRDADMQMAGGRPVEGEAMQPGDLAFFGEDGDPRRITHVAISTGGWKIIHSSRSRNGVYLDDIQQVEHLRESYAGSCTYLD